MAGCLRVERVREGRFASGWQGMAGIGGRCAAWSSSWPVAAAVAAQYPLHPTAQAGRNYPPGREGGVEFAAEGGTPRVSLFIRRR